MTYLILNTVVIKFNVFDHEDTLNIQRIIAAFSACFLWLKVVDWLRLFSGTAFFISLIGRTFVSIQAFIIVIFVIYMMFGTAFYILNLGLPSEEAIMPGVFDFWVLDAFES